MDQRAPGCIVVMTERETETKQSGSTDGNGPRCPKCGCDKPKIFVHGHYQCADCKCIADGDCCQGTMADG